ncbi:MAG: hypothetical protein NTV77_02885 [Candidatus Azambacteria bacterium]|nr:hypothetical protein [Candidatus Azambacteria bacterium]
MSVQQTLIIVKPDGLTKGLVGQILHSLKTHSLVVVDSATTLLPRQWVEELYSLERSEVYFTEVVDWVSSAPVLLLMVEGPDAIAKVKWQIIGRYPNGIRGQYSENWIKNVAHVPDSEESAERELNLSEQIFENRKKADKDLFKDKMIFALTGMSECGKSTIGKYLDSRGIPRLKIVRFFERIRDKWSPQSELYQFTDEEEKRNPYALWDVFLNELLVEMETRKVSRVSIESLYGGPLGPYLKHRMGDRFRIVYVDISLEIRLQRQMQREGLATTEEAKEILLPRDQVKADSGIPALKDIADEVIDNSGTREFLYQAIDELIARCK